MGKFVKHTTIQLKRNLLQVAVTTDTEWMYYDLHYYTLVVFPYIVSLQNLKESLFLN